MPTDPITWLSVAGERLYTNLLESYNAVSTHKAIRLVIIVCAYLLLRPYLLKFTGGRQMEQHEREAQAQKDREAAAINDEVRGIKVAAEIPVGDEDLEGESGTTDWGSKARKRQRHVLRKMLDAEEERLAEVEGDEEDKDIAEFLTED